MNNKVVHINIMLYRIRKEGLCLYTELVMNIIGIIGIGAFAASGAIFATKKHTDPFGTIVVAVITACGGGITRDILLGIAPPKTLVDPAYILISASVALFVYLIAFIMKDSFCEKTKRLDIAINIFDALGLGAFSVMGTQNAIDYGFSQNMFLCILIGVLTGCGGGFLRDITLQEIPVVLKKHIYVIAAILGSAAFYSMYISGSSYTLSAFWGIVLTFSLRMVATRFNWNLPPAY